MWSPPQRVPASSTPADCSFSRKAIQLMTRRRRLEFDDDFPVLLIVQVLDGLASACAEAHIVHGGPYLFLRSVWKGDLQMRGRETNEDRVPVIVHGRGSVRPQSETQNPDALIF